MHHAVAIACIPTHHLNKAALPRRIGDAVFQQNEGNRTLDMVRGSTQVEASWSELLVLYNELSA